MTFHYFRNTSPVPAPTNTTPASGLLVCHGTSATLTATGVPPGTLKWYDDPVAGTLLGQGPSFTTAPLFNNRTFYVEDNTSAGSSVRTAISVSVTQQINQLSLTTSQPVHCGHGVSVIQVMGTPSGIFYTLRNDLNDTTIMGPVEGSGFWIGLFTSDQTVTTTYNVLAQTINGSLVCEKEMAQKITITIKPLGRDTISSTVCYGESHTYLDGTVSANLTADESHESVFAGQSANGCDSIVTENISVLPELTRTFNPTVCAEESVTFNGTVYNAANPSGTEILTASTGCDSTVTVSLNVLPALSGFQFVTLCHGESIDINGTTYNAANPSGTEVYTAANGCDSTVMIMLMIMPEIIGTYNPTICNNESVEINGTLYNAGNPSGTEIFTAANGCDSTVTVSLNVLPQLSSTYHPAICYGESIEFNGTTYNSGHLYGVEVLTASNGCDSLVYVYASILPELTGSYNPTLCFGESVEVNGTTYDVNNPVGTEIFTASSGCDSTVTVSLNILPELTGSYTATMCADEEIEINGTVYNAANPTGTEVLSSVDGCDSTVTINLSIFTAEILVYPGTPGLLSAEPDNAEYQWINCATGEEIPGATAQSFTAEEQGSYAVIVTSDGCSDTSNCASPAHLGINDQAVSLVKLYPNPATTSFRLSGLENLSGIREMSLLDMNGKQLLLSEQVVSEWTIADLESGVYWLHIVHKTGVENLRFIKE